METEGNRPASELTSWKAIADYLGINVRTAQRWETERGLPIHRLGGDRGRVIASRSELDQWKTELYTNTVWWKNLRFLHFYSVSVTILALAAIAIALPPAFRNLRKNGPYSFFWRDLDLVITDDRARELWRHRFPDTPLLTAYDWDLARERVRFEDLDGDGRPEVVVAYISTGRDKYGTELDCFSEGGKLLWRYSPGRKVADRTDEYAPIYVIRQYRLFPEPLKSSSKWIATANVHFWSHPAQIAVHDSAGRLMGEYWHSGHLEVLEASDLDGDGVAEIVAGGVDIGRQQAVLVVLDPRKVSGASVEPEGSNYQLRGFAPGNEKAIVYFPRTSLNKRFEQYNFAYDLKIAGGEIKVQVKERMRSPFPFLIYVFDRSLNVKTVAASTTLRNQYKELRELGARDLIFSDHDLDLLRQQVQVIRR